MYTLYGSRGSGSAAAEMGLHAAGLPYRVVRASRWEADSAQEELRKVNPLLQIPTLVLPDGAVMTESAAILMHLGLDAAPASALLPKDPRSRAQSLRGLVYIPANCYSGITILDYPGRFTTATDEPSLEAIRQGTRAQMHRNWEVFADTFPATPFLAGDAPGALDFLAVVVSKWGGTRQHLQVHRPRFTELLARIQAHPAVAPVYSQHWDS
ncbi:glutathione S-transferase family protein [Caenimonas aquaedulcis]|uniref:Glutathione S-transferase family protein n=1 Tax=Caenimonas aquaedulcis TaxID=2793270 RepID=A0A931MJH5_9BURK|nr:glutathione S-transferase family protein [Caenimonas aquaedulcis]MBG9390305.1 glutathione S-transferase family protein [Caenimonas aquaedulcis]